MLAEERPIRWKELRVDTFFHRVMQTSNANDHLEKWEKSGGLWSGCAGPSSGRRRPVGPGGGWELVAARGGEEPAAGRCEVYKRKQTSFYPFSFQ